MEKFTITYLDIILGTKNYKIHENILDLGNGFHLDIVKTNCLF
jgi:hypothetical protein